jgi:hypothetical protein
MQNINKKVFFYNTELTIIYLFFIVFIGSRNVCRESEKRNSYN